MGRRKHPYWWVDHLDPTPLLDAARAGHPWHLLKDCPYCYGRSQIEKGFINPHFGIPASPWSAQCLTIAEVAARLGVTDRTVGRWKAGSRIAIAKGVDRLYELCDRVGAHPEVLWPELTLWSSYDDDLAC